MKGFGVSGFTVLAQGFGDLEPSGGAGLSIQGS